MDKNQEYDFLVGDKAGKYIEGSLYARIHPTVFTLLDRDALTGFRDRMLQSAKTEPRAAVADYFLNVLTDGENRILLFMQEIADALAHTDGSSGGAGIVTISRTVRELVDNGILQLEPFNPQPARKSAYTPYMKEYSRDYRRLKSKTYSCVLKNEIDDSLTSTDIDGILDSLGMNASSFLKACIARTVIDQHLLNDPERERKLLEYYSEDLKKLGVQTDT